MFSKKLRTLAFFLMSLMVFYVLPINCMQDVVSALSSDETASSTEETEASLDEETYVLGEDISKREESAKHFRMSDGSYVAVQYAEPVHYLDENGEYTEYDNTLTLNQSSSGGLIGNIQIGSLTTENITAINGFKANKSDVSITLANSASQSALTSISKGEYSVSIIPLSLNTSSRVVVNNTSEKPTLSGKPTIEEASKLYNHTSSVKYTDLFNGADLEYVLSGSKLKENIIVNEKASSYVYRFNLNLTGLYATLNEDGSISLIGSNTDKVEFTIPAGYMFDAAGKYSEGVTYTLSSKPNGNYTLTVTADSEWINTPDRVFPITVDPTLFVGVYGQGDAVSDTYVASNSVWANSSRDSVINLVVGYAGTAIYGNSTPFDTTKTYIKLDTLPEIGKASVITSAELILRHDRDNQCGKDVKISVKEIFTEAQGTITWNNQPTVDSIILDYAVVKHNTSGKNNNVSWDITKAAKKWYEDLSSNKGLCLEEMSGNTAENTFASFFSYNSTYYNNQTGIEPMFKICYRDTKGIDNRWSYNSVGAGAGGTLNVNLFNGNLVVANSVMLTNGSILPVEIANVYNAYLANSNFSETEKSGFGWQLTVHERMDKVTLGDVEYIKYTTSTGTELYFEKFGNVYYSEDDYSLYITHANNEYILKDDSDNVKAFFGDGRLKYIADANGNKKTFSYTSDKLSRISNVYQENGNTVTEVAIKFEYNSLGYLSKIINVSRDENYYVEYYYSSTPTGTPSKTDGGYLRKIVHSNGASCSYDYNYSTGLLSAVYDNETNIWYDLEYSIFHKSTLQKTYKLKKVTQVASNGSDSCSPFSIDYQEKRTVVRTWGSDEMLNNDDDILTTYVFDNHGRTISAYSTDATGKEIYGASNAEYIDVNINENGTLKEDYKQNNKIKTDGVSGYAAINLLNNSSFEISGSWSVRRSNSNKPCSYQSTQKYIGNKAIKLNSPEQSGYVSAFQKVTLEAGTYTLSAYVKAENITGDGAYLKLGENTSNKITGTTNATIENGWQRIYVTATLTAGTYEAGMFIENATGTVYFDCIQLEKASAPSRYNLVENGGMDKNNAWSGTYETDSEKGTVSHLVGNYNEESVSSQTVNLNLSAATTTFILKGFGKAKSASLIKRGNEEYTSFAITAKFTLNTGETEEFSVNFNPSTDVWQYGSTAICLENREATITSVEISLNYNYNVNEAFFDDVSLTIEPAQTYTYDNEGNVIKVTSADGNEDETKYESTSSPSDITSYTNIYGEIYAYEYTTDSVNIHQVKKVTKTSAGKTVSSESTYDQYGNVTSEKVSNASQTLNLTSSQTYSNRGNYISSVTDANGITYEYIYDPATNLLTLTKDGVDNTTRFVYDGKDRPTSIFVDANNNGTKDTFESSVNYSYTSSGYLSQIETASTAYVFSYDSFGNKTVIGIDGMSTALATYTYGANNGKLKRTDYGNGTYIENVYDSLDRVVETKYNGVVKYTFVYNGDGQLAQSNDLQNNYAYTYEYDSLGRLIRGEAKSLAEGGTILSYENMYDSLDRPSSSKYVIDGVATTYSLVYLENSTLIDEVNISCGGSETTVEYTYDSLERISNKKVTFDDTYIKYDYLYKDSGTTAGTLLEEITVCYDSNTESLNFIYSYDANGNIVQIKEGNTVKQSFVYDNLNQLVRENNAYSNETYVFTYETNGNILSKKTYSYTTGTLGTLLSTINYTYGNDAWGDLLTNYNGTNIAYDEIGNPLNWRNITSMTWTMGKRLTAYTYVKDSKTYNVTLTYDENGIRTSKLIKNANNASDFYFTNYVLDGTKILREVIIKNGSISYIYYIYDASGDVIGLKYGSGTSYSTYYYGKNAQGDVVALFDSSSQLVARYYYDAWGNVISVTDATGNEITSQTHIAHVNPIRYRSYYYDKETGFYYLNSRYYDSSVGRFINAEPNILVGQFDGGAGILAHNVFAYCANNPVSNIDKNGDFVFSISVGTLMVIAAVITVGVYVYKAYDTASTIKTCVEFIQIPNKYKNIKFLHTLNVILIYRSEDYANEIKKSKYTNNIKKYWGVNDIDEYIKICKYDANHMSEEFHGAYRNALNKNKKLSMDDVYKISKEFGTVWGYGNGGGKLYVKNLGKSLINKGYELIKSAWEGALGL